MASTFFTGDYLRAPRRPEKQGEVPVRERVPDRLPVDWDSDDAGHGFRLKPATYSDRSRPG